jgi:hypothetical protein
MGSRGLVRQPDFAGSWYPGRAEAVRAELDRLRALVHQPTALQGRLVGGIVPHAGWTFSGRLAFDVLAAIARSGPAPRVVVIFGKHMGPRDAPTIMRRGAWSTPLGELPMADELADAVVGCAAFEEETAEHYERDNTIELQLPFVKELFPEASILPIGAPARADSMAIGQAVARAARELGLPICVVGSTDLTHYGPNYQFSPKGHGASAEEWVRAENDRAVVDHLVALDGAQALEHAREHRSACCPGAAIAALSAARELGASAGELLDYATSNDVHPGGASFVGYAGIVYG